MLWFFIGTAPSPRPPLRKLLRAMTVHERLDRMTIRVTSPDHQHHPGATEMLDHK